MTMSEDEKWMQVAIDEANLAKNEDEVPVGAVIISDGRLIAQAHNQPISKNDPTAHAEIQVIRSAGEFMQNYRLVDTTLYVTLEPCLMCLGAIMHSRIHRLVFGAYDPKTGVCGSCADLRNEKFFFHKLIIDNGILEKKCRELLLSFFSARR
jgi:tRNA(adenine34) deaminase